MYHVKLLLKMSCEYKCRFRIVWAYSTVHEQESSFSSMYLHHSTNTYCIYHTTAYCCSSDYYTVYYCITQQTLLNLSLKYTHTYIFCLYIPLYLCIYSVCSLLIELPFYFYFNTIKYFCSMQMEIRGQQEYYRRETIKAWILNLKWNIILCKTTKIKCGM